MKALDYFKDTLHHLLNKRAGPEKSRQLNRMLEEGDTFILNLIDTPDMILHGGETVLTQAIKYLHQNMKQKLLLCLELIDKHPKDLKTILSAGAMAWGDKNPGMKRSPDIVVRLYSKEFRNKLGISDEKEGLFYDEKNLRAVAAYKEILKLFPCDKNEIVLTNLQKNTADISNASYEKPSALYKAYLKDKSEYSDFLNKTQSSVDIASLFIQRLDKEIPAQDFIVAAMDSELQKALPWLAEYKPDERTFVALFCPDMDSDNKEDSSVERLDQGSNHTQKSISLDNAFYNNKKFFSYENDDTNNKTKPEEEKESITERLRKDINQNIENVRLEVMLEKIRYYEWQEERFTNELMDKLLKVRLLEEKIKIEQQEQDKLEREEQRKLFHESLNSRGRNRGMSR